MDTDNKLNNYLKITGIINNMLRPQKTLKNARIKLCTTLALPAMLHNSENWTIKARDARRITKAHMKYIRKTAGYIWMFYRTNTEMAKEVHITPVEKIQEYRRSWLHHINRMSPNRLLRKLKNYRPTGRRNMRRPLKRLLDVQDRNRSTCGPSPC